jgi:hypothetical protein
LAAIQAMIGVVQDPGDVLGRHARGRHASGIQVHADRVVGPADQPDVSRAGDALQFGLDAAGDPFQVARGFVRGVQRQCDDGDVVDAAWPDFGRLDAEPRRHPCGRFRPQRVVQAHQRLGARDADLELDGQYGLSGHGHGCDVLGAFHPGQDAFSGRGDDALDVAGRGSRPCHHDRGHGDVDLGLFLAGRDREREQSGQQQG